MKFYARKSWGNFTVDVFAYQKTDGNKIAVMQPVTLTINR